MALDESYAKGSSINNTNHATFIPKLWSDEIIAEYEKSLVMKPLVKSMKMTGKKGDTINIPMPVRGEANASLAERQRGGGNYSCRRQRQEFGKLRPLPLSNAHWSVKREPRRGRKAGWIVWPRYSHALRHSRQRLCC